MQDLDAGKRKLTGEIQALHSRIDKLEQVGSKLTNPGNVDDPLDNAWREWETTFDAIKDSVILTDSDFKIIQANLATSQLFNKPLDEIVGKTCWQLVHRTDRAPKDCPLKRVKNTKKHEEIELYLPQNGIWAADSVDPVLDQQGNLTGVVHIIRDITDRKRAEGLLRKERDRAQKYLDVAGVMLVAIDAEQRVGLINKKGCEILGYSENEILAKNWFDNFLPKKTREEVREIFEKIISGEVESLEYYENPILTKNGGERLIAWHNTVLRDDKGQVIAVLSSGEDITERNKAEEACRLSEEKFAKAFNSSPAAIFITTLKEGRFIDLNERAIKVFGYTREEVVGHTAKELNMWANYNDRDIVVQSIRRGNAVRDMETRFRRKSGEVFDGIISVDIINIGGMECLISTTVDITERKKAEEALRETSDYLQNLIAYANAPIIVWDTHFLITQFNRAFESLTGRKASDVIGKSLELLFPPAVVENTMKLIRKTLTGERWEVIEISIQHIDGSVRTVLWNSATIFAPDGKTTVAIIAQSQDITERKKAEEALRENEEKYRDLFENAREAILTLDLKGNITGVNKLVEEYGFKREELIGRSHFDFIAEKSRNKAFKEFERLTQGTPVEGEVEVITPKGNRIVEYRNNPIWRGGQIVGIQEILIDVTERKKAEQQLLKDQAQLKSLASQLTLAEERERRRLAMELHDRIGQALVISKIKLEALRKSGYGKKLDKALDDVCNSLGQTIQDTRTLTFDLGNPILYELGLETAVSHWLTEQIQNKYKIETEFEDDGHPKPLDDDVRTLLFRDVRELLINVVKHAKASKVKVSVAKIDDRICISVEDNGKGFDAGKIASISAKANGYGLFSIRHRLEQLGGHLEIESTPGCGCKVTMTAPLKQKGDNNGRNRAISQGNGN
jgi:PAS domain S-box-containing protein